jgi:hypothetical protein
MEKSDSTEMDMTAEEIARPERLVRECVRNEFKNF